MLINRSIAHLAFAIVSGMYVVGGQRGGVSGVTVKRVISSSSRDRSNWPHALRLLRTPNVSSFLAGAGTDRSTYGHTSLRYVECYGACDAIEMVLTHILAPNMTDAVHPDGPSDPAIDPHTTLISRIRNRLERTLPGCR